MKQQQHNRAGLFVVFGAIIGIILGYAWKGIEVRHAEQTQGTFQSSNGGASQ